MKKLVVPSLLAFLMFAPQAQAGYFAFHADIIGNAGDLLGDYGRPDSDEDDCDTQVDDSAQCDVTTDDSPEVVIGVDAWYDMLADMLSL